MGDRETAPVPTGIQRLLHLASADEAFRRELLARRVAAADAAGVELTRTEAAILRAVPEAQLAGTIDGLPVPPPDRRAFLARAAAAAVLALAGGVLATGCGEERPAAPAGNAAAAADAAPPPPPPPPPPPDAAVDGGSVAAPPPAQPQPTRGIRPDVPQRPIRNRPSKGHRPDKPCDPDDPLCELLKK